MKKLKFDEIYDIRAEQIIWRHNRSIVIHALCRGRPVEEIAEYVPYSIDAILNVANNIAAVIYELVRENIISVTRGAELLRITKEEFEERMKNEGYWEQDL